MTAQEARAKSSAKENITVKAEYDKIEKAIAAAVENGKFIAILSFVPMSQNETRLKEEGYKVKNNSYHDYRDGDSSISYQVEW